MNRILLLVLTIISLFPTKGYCDQLWDEVNDIEIQLHKAITTSNQTIISLLQDKYTKKITLYINTQNQVTEEKLLHLKQFKGTKNASFIPLSKSDINFAKEHTMRPAAYFTFTNNNGTIYKGMYMKDFAQTIPKIKFMHGTKDSENFEMLVFKLQDNEFLVLYSDKERILFMGIANSKTFK